ncbi:MAG: hypothetical protein Q4F17_08920 [Eubacteriales bacterium]|nr:hypothetical protein [Eubacteriales bacterium]
MAKDEFDIDFDFEDEYGFDPKAFLSNEEYDEDIDLDQFTDEELGLHDPSEEESADEPEAVDQPLPEDEELPYAPLEDFQHYGEAPYAPDASYEEEPEEELTGEFEGEEPEEPDDAEPLEEEPVDEEPEDDQEPKKPRRTRKPREPKPKREFHTPKFLEKFYDIYFAPLTNKRMLEEPQDPNNPRRRRRKTRGQIFKEVYLPAILVGLCMVMVLSFAMGAVANAISQYTADRALQQGQLETSSNAAQLAQQEYQRIMQEAEAYATEYNYEKAIEVLNGFTGSATEFPDVSAKSAEYAQIQNQLVEYKDPSLIPNLSFHVLINDFERAKQNTELAGKYNQNFVTTKEFKAILDQLYANGYVLVDLDSFISTQKGVDGSDMFFDVPVLLPDGKKPVMLTQTLVNYYGYMINDEDGKLEADANGDGFASKLVLQNGEIKAEYVDATGATLVGDYDFVPILETFIAEHPDFVYRGARTILAVTGNQGVFGYRINTDLISTKGNDYHDKEVSGAKEIVQALRDKGYRIASFTYGNKSYKELTVAQIQDDQKNWASQVTPVIGAVDTLVYAQEADISEYPGAAFDVLYNAGYRFFISNTTDDPWAEVNASYVRQKRLMVSGKNMMWHKDAFDGIFDCGAVLDLNVRGGTVPNS